MSLPSLGLLVLPPPPPPALVLLVLCVVGVVGVPPPALVLLSPSLWMPLACAALAAPLAPPFQTAIVLSVWLWSPSPPSLLSSLRRWRRLAVRRWLCGRRALVRAATARVRASVRVH